MNLHQDREIFANAIVATAQKMGIREVYIEKDYWVTYALKCLANSDYRDKAIFKGGTSLSKALNLIERFSEDIDLAVVVPEGTSGNKVKALIKKVQKTTAGNIPEINIEGITSKFSKFRKTVHQYDRITEGENYGQASDKLLIEVNAFAKPHPHTLHEIQSYIAEYLTMIGRLDLTAKYKLESFKVNVLQLERTFTEKILGLIRISKGENSIIELRKKIRHIYDLERILKENSLVDFLNSPNFFGKIAEVKKDDSNNHEFAGEWMSHPLISCPLFGKIEETWKELEHTYLTDFKPLVYGYLPSSNEIKQALSHIAVRLSAYDQFSKSTKS